MPRFISNHRYLFLFPVLCFFSLVLVIFAKPGFSADTDKPSVVVTIKPLHSLVAGVMAGVAEPYLLLKGSATPHHFQLKPSQALKLNKADLIIWVGPSLESPLVKTVKSIGSDKSSFEILKLADLTKLEFRSPHHHDHEDEHNDEHAGKDSHDHEHDHDKDHAKKDEHDHDHEEEHAKKEDHDHDHEEEHAKKEDHDHDHDEEHAKKEDHDHDHDEEHAKKEDHDHDHDEDHAKKEDHDHDHDEHHAKKDEHDHSHAGVDPHIWLDTDNAIVITKAVRDRLSEIAPSHAKIFQKNAEAQIQRLEALKSELAGQLNPVKKRPYMVFHDAYQYFTKPIGLSFEGAITLNPSRPVSAAHLKELRETLNEKKIVCVFSEPQFSDKTVKALIGKADVKIGQLDPLGAALAEGPDAYSATLRGLADAFKSCLAP